MASTGACRRAVAEVLDRLEFFKGEFSALKTKAALRSKRPVRDYRPLVLITKPILKTE